MNGKEWSDAEVELFRSMDNAEIAKATGRTMQSVRMKRYRMSGHYTNTEDRDKVYCPPSRFESKETRIFKIIALAKKIGVKLKDE